MMPVAMTPLERSRDEHCPHAGTHRNRNCGLIQVLPGGREGRILHQVKTTRKANTCDPTWNEAFTLDLPVPVQRTKLRLAVWTHDLGGIGNSRRGQVELPLTDPATTRGEEQEMELLDKQDRVTKTAEGCIRFSVKAAAVRRAAVRSRLQNVVSFAARVQSTPSTWHFKPRVPPPTRQHVATVMAFRPPACSPRRTTLWN